MSLLGAAKGLVQLNLGAVTSFQVSTAQRAWQAAASAREGAGHDVHSMLSVPSLGPMQHECTAPPLH